MNRLISFFALAVALSASGEAVPLKRLATGHVAAPVKVNDRDADFIIDTAASQTVIFQSLADRLSLQPFPGASESLVGATGTQQVELLAVGSIELDGKRRGLVRALRQDASPSLNVQGILGSDFLSNYVADFDLVAGELRLREDMDSIDTAGWEVIPISFNRRIFPMLKGELDGVPLTIVLDTGAQLSILNSAAAAKLAPATGKASAAGTPGHGPQARGATGHAMSLQVRDFTRFSVESLKLDANRLAIADLPVFANLGLNATPSMILGLDKLRGSRLIIDYPRSRLLIRRSPS